MRSEPSRLPTIVIDFSERRCVLKDHPVMKSSSSEDHELSRQVDVVEKALSKFSLSIITAARL